MNENDIINMVCKVCGITPEQIKERSRKEPLPTARALIVHFLHKELRMIPRDIMPLIGHMGCDRTLIYHYLGRNTLIEKRIPFQKQLREKVERIQAGITTGKTPVHEKA